MRTVRELERRGFSVYAPMRWLHSSGVELVCLSAPVVNYPEELQGYAIAVIIQVVGAQPRGKPRR